MTLTKLLTTIDLVEKYGVSRQAVSKWRLAGLKHKKLSERVIVYDEQEVRQWLVNRGSKVVEQEEN